MVRLSKFMTLFIACIHMTFGQHFYHQIPIILEMYNISSLWPECIMRTLAHLCDRGFIFILDTNTRHPFCSSSSVLVFPSVPLPGFGTLQKVQVPIISQSSCQEMYQTDPTEQVNILYDMICAGYQEGGKDSCQVLLDQLFVLCLY